jgi:hypothetical protein
VHGQASSFRFVRASARLLAACRETAREVGYAVPCPKEVPKDLTQAGLIAADQAPTWRGWVFGSTSVGSDHLVLTASPRRLANYAKLVNGPAWYPKARVKLLAWVTVGGRRMRVVYVPPDTNDGSAFAHHVVLIWSVGQHTYGIGFHAVHGFREALRDDVAVTRHLSLVQP